MTQNAPPSPSVETLTANARMPFVSLALARRSQVWLDIVRLLCRGGPLLWTRGVIFSSMGAVEGTAIIGIQKRNVNKLVLYKKYSITGLFPFLVICIKKKRGVTPILCYMAENETF